MMKFIGVVCGVLMSIPCLAAGRDELQYRLVDAAAFDFTAPVVAGTGAVSDRQVGMIVYDTSSNQFKGLNATGNWDAMTVPNSNVVSSSGSQERTERASVNTTCTTSPCTVTSQSGTWVSSVVWNSMGHYTINFVPGVFSAPPSCIAMVNQFKVGSTALPTTTSWTIFSSNNSGAPTDAAFQFICMGPR